MKTKFELTPEETARFIREGLQREGVKVDEEADVGFAAEMVGDKLKDVRAVVKGEIIKGEAGPTKPLELKT